MSANRIARASATKGELTKDWVLEPVIGDGSVEPEKIQASPACFDCCFQAVSVEHVMLVGVWVRFSKFLALRANQIAQHTHGTMLLMIPDGGRQTAFLNLTIAFLNSSSGVMLILYRRGICFQTSIATGHSKKVVA